MVEVKFCGMTRPDDVQHAVGLGAAWVGAIFTTSPRRVEPEQAAAILAPTSGTPTRRVGVFGDESLDWILDAATKAGLEVVQLHRPRPAADLDRLHEARLLVWTVLRVGPDGLGAVEMDQFRQGDAIVLDTLAAGVLGGTGRTFDWSSVAARIAGARTGRRIVLAGGLRPGNVADAVARLAPDVVDVSSGVEHSPGVKDHRRMSDFMAAAQAVISRPA